MLSIVVVTYGDNTKLPWINDPQLAKNIIIVNNSCGDDAGKPATPSLLNYGYSKAAQAGAIHTHSEWILFCNPDISITADIVKLLLDHAHTYNLSAVSPLLCDEQSQPQWQYHQPLPTFTTLLRQWWPHRLITFFARSPVSKQTSLPPLSTLPGACLLIKRAAWHEIGGWDERFWLWWEDADLSWRLHQAGLRFGVIEKVRVTHEGGATFKSLSDEWKKQVFFHSLRIFIRKHFRGWRRRLLEILTWRFDQHKLYPIDHNIRASVVVPNMRADLLRSFLERHAPTWQWQHDELIVVTSAPEARAWQPEFPHVIWIFLEQNSGFASTVNIGLRRARGKWLGTVNDDTQLPTDWIARLVQSADHQTGSLSPVVVKLDGEIESAGVNYDERGRAVPVKIRPTKNTAADTCNAAAVLFAREAIEAVGLFDERFGSYLEDIDLGLRLRRAGWLNVVVPTVDVIHLGQQTSAARPVFKSWLDVKNWWLVVLKNTTLSGWWQQGGAILEERLRNISGFMKTWHQA